MTAPLSNLRTEHLAPLLRLVEQGDRTAADELISRASARLELLARHMLRRFPVVRGQIQTTDVIQEACLRLLNALREVKPKNTAHFFSLATRQINFHLLDLARHYRRGGHQTLPDHAEPATAEKGPAEAAEELERWEAFLGAIEKLPAEERAVFGLRYDFGFTESELTWKQIGELLGVVEKTARRRWDRACLKLREALGSWALPEGEGAGAFDNSTH